MSASKEFQVKIPEPSPDQLLALEGLAAVYGWRVNEESPLTTQLEAVTPTASDIDISRLVGEGKELSLKDEVNMAYESESEEQKEKNRKKLILVDLAGQILQPYNSLFDHKIPSAGSNTRTLVFRRPEVGKENTTRWHYSDVNERNPLLYSFLLTYIQGEEVNAAKKVTMDIRTEKEEAKRYWKNEGVTPTLELRFTDTGEIWYAELSCREAGREVLEKVLEGTTAGEVIKQIGVPLSHRDDEIEIGIDTSRGVLIHNQSAWVDDEQAGYSRPVKLKNEYRIIDAKDGVVERFTVSDYNWRIVGDQRDIKPGTSISAQEYFHVLSDLVYLIPVTSQAHPKD